MSRCLPDQGTTQGSLEQKLWENNTAILADTLHFETLSMHEFSGSILSPTRVFEALAAKQIDYYIWVATKKVFEAQEEQPNIKRRECTSRVIEQLLIELANAIGDRIPGPHVVPIDPRKHDNMSSMVESAQRMHRIFRIQGVPQGDIIVSIPATEAGILAAQHLQEEGFGTNLYLVTSLMHAAACAEAKAAAISIPVGPLLEIYERKRNTVYQDLTKHPGIQTVQSILAYFKLNKIKPRILGTDFRNMAEIGMLSECDAVCVSAEQADKLRWSRVPTASLDLREDPQVVLRAGQAKHPTDLLTRKGGFSSWFSPESRNLTTDLLRDALAVMKGQMNIIEHVVKEEVDRRLFLQKSLKAMYKVEFPHKIKWPEAQAANNKDEGSQSETDNYDNPVDQGLVDQVLQEVMQNLDDVF
ncbi:hypothetical protein BDZ97DRAFT_2076952 [Flammula alnicola]|nr:hypothetical protein BDZ97DRAFT_2076952 [Flammula alnicola]